MKHSISCTRCGNRQQAITDSHEAWAEIICHECGDFIDTYGHWEESFEPSYILQTLNRSRALTLQMAREANPLNNTGHWQSVTA